jgi:hypothetical protein
MSDETTAEAPKAQKQKRKYTKRAAFWKNKNKTKTNQAPYKVKKPQTLPASNVKRANLVASEVCVVCPDCGAVILVA